MVFDFQKGSEGSGDTPIIPVFWVLCRRTRKEWDPFCVL